MKCSFLLLILLILGAVSCQSPRPAMTPAEAAKWIKTFTPEQITTSTTIEVEFTSPIGAGVDSIAAIKKAFVFSPSLRGEARWENGGSTLVFMPREGALKQARTYECRVRMDEITGKKEMKDFVFSFYVAEKESRLAISKVSIIDSGRVAAEGTLWLSEPIEASMVKKELLSCTHTDSLTRISINGGGDRYNFTISGLKRSELDVKTDITFHADKIGFGDTKTVQTIIPGTNEFKVLAATKIDSSNPYIEIEFSDALDTRQELDGIITIDQLDRITLQRASPTIVRVLFDGRGFSELTLRVGAEVRSVDGRRLFSEVEKRFKAEVIPPAVEIPLSGTILPDAGNLTMPFRAVNLAAVDVQVFKIYQSNILNFLHDNELDESYRLRRVGKLIFRQTVRLDKDPNLNLHRWQNFSVDLTGLFRQERGAIYRVKISFKHDYSLYDHTPGEIKILSGVGDAESVWIEDGFDWDEWNWKERDNPSKRSYYMVEDRFPEYNLMASNIGLIVKSADNGRLWCTTSDIVTAGPIEGVRVAAYNYQLKEIGHDMSDANGFVDFTISGKPFVVTATRGGASSYLKVEPGYAKSLSRFDVGGKEPQGGLRGFIYGERGVWRPGDTVHLTLVIEDKNHTLPRNHPVIMEIHTPQGQFHDRQTLTNGVNGFYTFAIATSDNSPTGTWDASFKVGGKTFHKSVRIETIKPNRLKVNLAARNMVIKAGVKATFDIESHWLSGHVAAGLATTLEMTLRRHPRPFDKYRDYTFSNPLISFASDNYEIASTKLDSLGKGTVHKIMSAKKNAPGMLLADVICRIAEPGGETSIVSQSLDYSPYDAYVGINLYNAEFETNKDLTFPVIVLDEAGRKLSGRTLEYKIYKLEWSWWWEYGATRLNSYVHDTSAEIVADGLLTTSSGVASVPFRINYPAWGKYLVFVKDIEGGHATGGVIRVDWPSWRGYSNKSNPNAVSMLAFTLDKTSYEVGEQAVVCIPAAEGGRALVSIENASGVISRNWVRTAAAKETTYKIPITRAMSPNCYVHITLLQPYRQAANDLPIRMYGVQPMRVTNRASHLAPTIQAPDVVRPQQPFTVRVREKQGRAMTYTLAVVDEGLLDITGYRTPNLWGAMNLREALGVKTWDLYDDVVGAYTGQWSSVLSIGGDEALNVAAQKEKRFNPVVQFLGPFTLGGGSRAHKITLPMYVGSVRVMVVAGQAGAYGSADKAVTVRSPLMVLSTVPRTLSNGEKFSLPVNIFAMEDGVHDVTVNVVVEGPLKIDGAASRSLTFTKPSDQLVNFMLASDQTKEGVAKIAITARGGGHTASEVVNVEVRNPNPPIVTSFSKLVNGGSSCDFSWQPFNTSASDEARLEIASFPAIDFIGTFEFTRNYAHLCSEQLLSRGFNLLYARRFLDEASAKQAEKMIPHILKKLYSRQLTGGGFCYWPGLGHAHDWVSSMAGQLLVEAQFQGFMVPSQVLSRWVEYQQKAAREYRHAADSDLQQAYRLYTLALAKNTNAAAMNKLRETEALSQLARLRLAAAYAIAGRREVAVELLSKAASTLTKTTYTTFGSPLRDQAMILETQVLAGQIAHAFETAANVVQEFSIKYCSTQEVAFVSLAMSRLADITVAKSGGVRFNQTGRDSRTILSPKAVAYHSLDPTIGKLHVDNLSEGQIAVNLMLHRRPNSSAKITAVSEGVDIKVKYTNLGGHEISVDRLRQGEEFVARITIAERSGMTNSPSMALTFIAPSGWEIWNERIAGQRDKANYTYKDMRDDRINWYFPLASGAVKEFSIRLRATYVGRFVLPPVVCEDMYNGRYRANTENSIIEVVR